MEYPECLNSNCVHNYDDFCKADGLGEDIICKQGKADVMGNKRDLLDQKVILSNLRFQTVLSDFY